MFLISLSTWSSVEWFCRKSHCSLGSFQISDSSFDWDSVIHFSISERDDKRIMGRWLWEKEGFNRCFLRRITIEFFQASGIYSICTLSLLNLWYIWCNVQKFLLNVCFWYHHFQEFYEFIDVIPQRLRVVNFWQCFDEAACERLLLRTLPSFVAFGLHSAALSLLVWTMKRS